MSQDRFLGATNSILGKTENALESMIQWVKVLMRRLGSQDNIEDTRMLPFLYNEIGMIKRRAGERELNFMLPFVNTALIFAHTTRPLVTSPGKTLASTAGETATHIHAANDQPDNDHSGGGDVKD
ncbi:hypothetical protein Daus18300_005724 [Diaporthe australafricana]|uniref:Cytochrome P450 n=1 Tax=Diaporthe australafricana TaxID=127596 RepID=A0ABR3WZJ4_9PEZI